MIVEIFFDLLRKTKHIIEKVLNYTVIESACSVDRDSFTTGFLNSR